MTNIENFSDLTTLSRREVQSAFRSIVDFPHEEVILGATPASLRETLDRVCFVLTDDHNVMPAALCYQINASCKPDEDLQSGANYAAGAAVVQANFETWRRSTTDQLGFASSKRASCSLKGPPREAVEASPIG